MGKFLRFMIALVITTTLMAVGVYGILLVHTEESAQMVTLGTFLGYIITVPWFVTTFTYIYDLISPNNTEEI